MRKKHKILLFIVFATTILLTAFLYPYAYNSAVLDPKGIIALKERDLIYISTLLMLIVVIPVYILYLVICWRYRASNKDAEYTPNWNHDVLAEIIWWGFPCLIIIFLSIVTWRSSHDLDPFRPLETSVKPVKIQVVALQWKWLFIYPEHQVASVNFFQFPEQTPVNFEITADAPMNSFWIPQLSGQIYAMPGMNTKLHILSHEAGEFRGSSANFSGTDFAAMTFIAKSSSEEDFDKWIKSIDQSTSTLSLEEYRQLAKPGTVNSPLFFKLKDAYLYDRILMKYMHGEDKIQNKVAYHE